MKLFLWKTIFWISRNKNQPKKKNQVFKKTNELVIFIMVFLNLDL